MNAIEGRIAEVLANQLRLDSDVIDPEATFESLSIDSLVLVELSLLLSDEFGVDLDDGELTSDMRIGDAADLIADRMVSL
jgi:acyl carrier protein